MGKRITALLLIVVLVSNSVFAGNAIDINKLTPDKQQIYIRESLTVQSGYETKMSAGGYGAPMGYGAIYSGWGLGKTELKWTPYKGPSKMSKSQFFNITNQVDLAVEAEKKENQRRNMLIAGGCFLGLSIGGSALLSGILIAPTEDSTTNLALLLTGCISMTAGLIAGIPLLIIQPEPDIPVSFAINIANNYNQKLFDSLNR